MQKTLISAWRRFYEEPLVHVQSWALSVPGVNSKHAIKFTGGGIAWEH